MKFWEFCLSAFLVLCAWLSPDLKPRASRSPFLTKTIGISNFTNMAAYDQFILFGDSLFQHSSSQERGFGLASALQAEYIRRLDIVNRGFSGYNTDQALTILPHVLPNASNAHIRFLVVFLGANDACVPGAVGGQHVPLSRYKTNLKNIISHPQIQAHNPRIILVTPPPINEYVNDESDRAKGIPGKRRYAEHVLEYAKAAREVADEQKVALLDLFDCFLRHAGWDGHTTPLPGSVKTEPNPFLRMLLHDGLHFTNIAYTLFHQELMRTIHKHWPDQMPEKLPFVYPMWNDPEAWKQLSPSI